MYAWNNRQPNVDLGLHDQVLTHNGVVYEVQYDGIGRNWFASEDDRGLPITGADREKVKRAIEDRATHNRVNLKRDVFDVELPNGLVRRGEIAATAPAGRRFNHRTICGGCHGDWFKMLHGC
ncbi:hypothetical protein I5H03_gp009 [Mycobacterium phage Nibb]|uniref:Uncharacterized protein n=1 Tax=Mycobacterium phage Nibb TaxID=2510585 RepID=A0A411B5M3_9CAUD|nr:hypothetical protein I5H03_gp009 [Mycobacterium phage Nibb]QAX95637.1 hypothetical protein SEA_NIBB_98 [Mycobacterium phage Nibb]